MAKMRVTVFLQRNLASKVPFSKHILFIKNGSVCPHVKEGYHTGMSDISGRQAEEGLTLILQHFAFPGSEALEKAQGKEMQLLECLIGVTGSLYLSSLLHREL